MRSEFCNSTKAVLLLLHQMAGNIYTTVLLQLHLNFAKRWRKCCKVSSLIWSLIYFYGCYLNRIKSSDPVPIFFFLNKDSSLHIQTSMQINELHNFISVTSKLNFQYEYCATWTQLFHSFHDPVWSGKHRQLSPFYDG